MTLTFATLVFVPLAVWAAFRTSRTVAMLAGTVGFSGTAVLNIGSLKFGLQPYHLFGLLVIVRALLDTRVRRVDRTRRRVTWVLYALFGFWAVALFSIVAHQPGQSTVFYMVSQLVHLGFGIAVAWSLSRVVRTPATLKAGCRGFERGAVFIAAWGVMEFTLNQLGRGYPKFMFNNSIGLNADLSGGELIPGIIRAGSVATEPSALGRTLLIGLGMLLVRHVRGDMRERRWMVAGALIIVAGLIFSTSTTGLFGLVVLCGAGLVAGRRLRIQRLVALLAVVAVLIPTISPSVMQALYKVTLEKQGTYSFNGRKLSIDAARQTFRDHPWLGIGWGNFTSHDLANKVLSNTGVFGAACLLLVLFGLLIGRVRPEHAGALRPELRALKFGVLLSVAMDWVAGFNYPYGDIWVVGGLLLAAMTVAPATLRRSPDAPPPPRELVPDPVGTEPGWSVDQPVAAGAGSPS